jgi:hypothetical protein
MAASRSRSNHGVLAANTAQFWHERSRFERKQRKARLAAGLYVNAR